MPHYTTPSILSFSPPVTDAAAKAASPHPPAHVITLLIQLSDYLLGVAEYDTLFGVPDKNANHPSLHTLYDRLHIGRPAPSPILKEAKDKEQLRNTLTQRVDVPIKERPLQDFEDLYYVLMARMQEMLQTLNAWLHSEFIELQNVLFQGGPTIKDFHRGLAAWWDVLNEPKFARALDDAVRVSRLEYTSKKIMKMVEDGYVTLADAEPCLRALVDSWDTGAGVDFRILTWSPAMVGAHLEEKYRLVLRLEKENREIKARAVSRRAKMKGKVSDDDTKLRRFAKRSSLKATLMGIRRDRVSSVNFQEAPAVRHDQDKEINVVVDDPQSIVHANSHECVKDMAAQSGYNDDETWDFEVGQVHQESLHREIQTHFRIRGEDLDVMPLRQSNSANSQNLS